MIQKCGIPNTPYLVYREICLFFHIFPLQQRDLLQIFLRILALLELGQLAEGLFYSLQFIRTHGCFHLCHFLALLLFLFL